MSNQSNVGATRERPAPLALIAGGSGVVGPHVVNAFLRAGYRVRVLSRHAPDARLFAQPIEHIAGDICDADACARATHGADVALNLVACIHIHNPVSAEPYHRINVEGTRTLLHACQGAGVRRFVFFSSILVYGHDASRTSDSPLLDESAPLRPDTWYGETKAHAEEIALAAHDIEPVILRLAAVYGPRMKGNYEALMRAARLGVFVPIGRGENRRTLIHAQDVGEAALIAAQHAQVPHQIYNVSDGRTHTFAEILRAVYAALGKSPPRLHVPLGAAHLAADVSERAFALVGARSPIHRARVDKLVEDMAVSGDKFMRATGFIPQKTDLMSAWRDVLA